MQDRHKPALEPAIIVIFGVTGDLANRYLLPAIYRLFRDGLIDEKTEIVGLSRRQLDMDQIFANLEQSLNDSGVGAEATAIQRMRQHTHPFQLDMTDPEGYKELLITLNTIEEEQAVCMNRLYYLSIPPTAYGQTIEYMGQAGLNGSCQHGAAMTRLLVEKPFGHDLASAEDLIKTTEQAFGESQVYRIDHYLAKEIAQNIVTFRFENPIFEAMLNNRNVSHIDIVASEKIGIEGRAAFYEQQGALRDFIQNHLLQLLAIAAMDQPEHFDSDSVHAAKLKLLQAIIPIGSDNVTSQTKRGQYAGYRDEADNHQSNVETYASINTTIDTPRWQGVPVTIRTGKNMADKRTVVTFTFADLDKTLPNSPHTNDLEFRISPDEGIALKLLAKKPGFEQELQKVTMDFSYAQSFEDTAGPRPDAYERVLLDAVRGDRTLFASGPEVLAAWRVIDAVVQAWQASGDGLEIYQPGSSIEEL